LNSGAGPATVTATGGTQTIASLVTLGSTASFAPAADSQLTISGNIGEATANQALRLTGVGTLVLTGTGNTYTGGTYAEQGTLYVQNSGAILDGSSLVVGAGGTFVFDPTMTGSPLAATSSHMAVQLNPVPEPGTIVLLAVAAAVAGLGARRRRRSLSTEYTVRSTERDA